ncbi:hypothetical protein N2601_08675 [Rhizobium sp. CB3060]|uniref:hypothetical protein n=1 Tax=Rhizobium sp. CB3060 TaxID=3138255 RepID=UPI0021A6EFE2|nr:hypothetical protein [Rhizobium tropici]UWU23003.1 hypothetical protein N2601_08675 [Rhizobium tropici]
MTNKLPIPAGWLPLVDDLKQRAASEFRSLVFVDISAHPGGWLNVEIDKHSVSVEQHWRALKLGEGYSSMSLNICAECCRHHAERRPDHVFPICDYCRQRIDSNN